MCKEDALRSFERSSRPNSTEFLFEHLNSYLFLSFVSDYPGSKVVETSPGLTQRPYQETSLEFQLPAQAGMETRSLRRVTHKANTKVGTRLKSKNI